MPADLIVCDDLHVKSNKALTFSTHKRFIMKSQTANTSRLRARGRNYKRPVRKEDDL